MRTEQFSGGILVKLLAQPPEPLTTEEQAFCDAPASTAAGSANHKAFDWACKALGAKLTANRVEAAERLAEHYRGGVGAGEGLASYMNYHLAALAAVFGWSEEQAVDVPGLRDRFRQAIIAMSLFAYVEQGSQIFRWLAPGVRHPNMFPDGPAMALRAFFSFHGITETGLGSKWEAQNPRRALAFEAVWRYWRQLIGAFTPLEFRALSEWIREGFLSQELIELAEEVRLKHRVRIALDDQGDRSGAMLQMPGSDNHRPFVSVRGGRGTECHATRDSAVIYEQHGDDVHPDFWGECELTKWDADRDGYTYRFSGSIGRDSHKTKRADGQGWRAPYRVAWSHTGLGRTAKVEFVLGPKGVESYWQQRGFDLPSVGSQAAPVPPAVDDPPPEQHPLPVDPVTPPQGQPGPSETVFDSQPWQRIGNLLSKADAAHQVRDVTALRQHLEVIASLLDEVERRIGSGKA